MSELHKAIASLNDLRKIILLSPGDVLKAFELINRTEAHLQTAIELKDDTCSSTPVGKTLKH